MSDRTKSSSTAEITLLLFKIPPIVFNFFHSRYFQKFLQSFSEKFIHAKDHFFMAFAWKAWYIHHNSMARRGTESGLSSKTSTERQEDATP